jgi:hypothetical protein
MRKSAPASYNLGPNLSPCRSVIRNQSDAVVIFDNLGNQNGFAERLHERVMNRQDQILQNWVRLEMNNLKSNLFALIDVHMPAVILHRFVVGEFAHHTTSLAQGIGFASKHSSHQPIPDD